MFYEKPVFGVDASGYLLCLECLAVRMGTKPRFLVLGKYGSRQVYHEVLGGEDAEKWMEAEGEPLVCDRCHGTIASPGNLHEQKRTSRRRWFRRH